MVGDVILLEVFVKLIFVLIMEFVFKWMGCISVSVWRDLRDFIVMWNVMSVFFVFVKMEVVVSTK